MLRFWGLLGIECLLSRHAVTSSLQVSQSPSSTSHLRRLSRHVVTLRLQCRLYIYPLPARHVVTRLLRLRTIYHVTRPVGPIKGDGSNSEESHALFVL